MPDFTPALSTPGSWSVGDSQYGEGKYMQLKIPVSAVHELCPHLMAMADDAASHKSINVWNYQTSSAQDVPGIVLSCKGKDGQYGAFGQINPAKHGTATRPAAAATDMPF